MKLEKTSETNKTVVFQSDCTREEIDQAVQLLISNAPKDPFYVFKNPTFLLKLINYAGVRIRKEHIFIPRSMTTPPIYLEFENIPTEITFRVSYLPVFKWAFYVGTPVILSVLYRSIEKETSTEIILFAVVLGVLLSSILAFVAYLHDKVNTYFFKRDVNRIVKDLAPQFN